MTGSTLRGAPDSGTWRVIHDSSIEGAEWETVEWRSDEPGDSSLEVKVASSSDGIAFSSEKKIKNGGDLIVPQGRYLRVAVSFSRASNGGKSGVGDSPILYDLSVAARGAGMTGGDDGPPGTVTGEPEDVGRIRLGPPPPIDLGQAGPKSEAVGRLDLSDSEVEGTATVRISTDYEAAGSLLEVDLGDGWQPIDSEAVTLTVDPMDDRTWPVRVRVGRCPEGVSAAESFAILIETLGDDGPQETRVPLAVEVSAATWLQCWWPLLALLGGILVTGVIVHGFWSPFRFSPRLGVVLSPEEDMAEGFFHPIRAQRGSRSGFYRDARIYICQDFRLSAHRGGAIACLRAHSNRVRIEPVGMATLWRQNSDDSWEQLPAREVPASFGVIYKDELGTIFFEIRNG